MYKVMLLNDGMKKTQISAKPWLSLYFPTILSYEPVGVLITNRFVVMLVVFMRDHNSKPH
jgi:hypothetical protein